DGFLAEHGIARGNIAVAGVHGQTVLHRPQDRLTVQLIDAEALSRRCGLSVVHDLRGADVAAGGQGAPLVPVYHQALVAAAGLEVLDGNGFAVAPEQIRRGFLEVNWPGRMQVMATNPLIVVDGAHNPRATRALALALPREFSYRRLILLIGVMADKDIPAVLKGIVPMADFVIYTRPVYDRAADPEVLKKAADPMGKPCRTAGGLIEALDKAREMADSQDLILITGSLFTAGEALSILDPKTYRPDEV
ncbi:MAG: anhydro-N-acetylmuramic acid kinase, partial [Desulfobacteraceae bacterium]